LFGTKKKTNIPKLLDLNKERGEIPSLLIWGAPGMGDNLAVKVRCGLGSGNH
jgi:hypothetical protein